MQFSTNARIFCVLISRNLFLFSRQLKSTLTDCIPPLFTQIITFGYLFPLIGMPSSMIAPIYLGSMLTLFLQLGYAMVMKTGFDLHYNRFIDYHITLPISKRWLFGSYIINHMLEVLLITLPLYTIGILVLHKQFDIAHINVYALTLMYLFILTFFSTFFLAISYTATVHWIMDNVWPRILVPLWWFSSALVTWKKIFAWSPSISYIMLFSPITYIAEGMRSALLGTDQFIGWHYCILILCGFIVLNVIALNYGIKRKLDPV